VTIEVKDVVIGQWADYFDTGIWTRQGAELIAPQDLTMQQLKDFLLASGGAVYLKEDGRFGWLLITRGPC
jgi:hypothetical protein